MPAAAPAIPPADRDRLVQLGQQLRLARKKQGVSAVAAAEAAGISRITLHRIERGEPGVAMGTWMAVAGALGLAMELRDVNVAPDMHPLPERIRLDAYPQLRQLAWQLGSVETLTPKEALDLYERNWRHVDTASLAEEERAFITQLSQALGAGRLLV
jgi:transcriptional regulator with XRE-family HTH domain